jgi:hypothetical protein
VQQEALFVDGVPARITVADFRRFHLQSFPALTDDKYDDLIADGIDAVYAMFTGVEDLWDLQPAQIWYDKTTLCFRLLTAWYINDLYPSLAAGIASMGGIPLKRKKIGGVDITFAEAKSTGNNQYLDLLQSLKSNAFGTKAYVMITTAAKRVKIRNRRFV